MEQFLLKQTSNNDCGLSVSKMILAFYHRNLKFLKLDVSADLSDFLKIKQFCGRYGLELQGRKLMDQKELLKVRRPLIVQTKKDDKTHFLLIKRRGKGFIINDPGFGTYQSEFAPLLEEMTGYYLEMIGPRSRGFKLKRDDLCLNPLKRRHIVPFVGFHLFSIVSLFISFMIFDQAEYMHFSLILAAFSFVFYILSRQSLFKLNKEYDQLTSTIVEKESANSFIATFEKIHRIKSDFVSPFISLFTAVITSLILLALLAINDLKFLVVAGVVLLLLFIVQITNLHENFEYRNFEQLLVNTSKDEENRKENLKTISKKSQTFIQKKFVYSSLIDILLFFMVTIVMLINDLTSLNYLLLYFFIMLYLKNNLVTLFNWQKSISQYYTALNLLNEIAKKH